MVDVRVIPDPALIKRHNELFDLYDNWPGSGDPDDDPKFVEAARKIMGLPKLEAEVGDQRSLDDGSLRLRGILTDDEELDESTMRALFLVEERRLAGKDVTPGDNRLKRYWTKGPGLRKWLGHPHEWTTLRNHLLKYVGPERADRIAAQWFHDVKGFWPGADLHRVEHGKPPRGKRVGPG